MLDLYIHLLSLHLWIYKLLVPFWLGLILYIHSWEFWCCPTHQGDDYPTYTALSHSGIRGGGCHVRTSLPLPCPPLLSPNPIYPHPPPPLPNPDPTYATFCTYPI